MQKLLLNNKILALSPVISDDHLKFDIRGKRDPLELEAGVLTIVSYFNIPQLLLLIDNPLHRFSIYFPVASKVVQLFSFPILKKC